MLLSLAAAAYRISLRMCHDWLDGSAQSRKYRMNILVESVGHFPYDVHVLLDFAFCESENYAFHIFISHVFDGKCGSCDGLNLFCDMEIP